MTDYLVDRPEKDYIRRELFAERGLLDCVLTLPSTEFQCIRRGFEADAFHEDTHFILAEYDKEKADIIRNTWHKHIPFGHVHFFQGNLFDLDLQNLPLIDVAYVDLEGVVNIDELVWIHDVLSSRVRRHGITAVTHSARIGNGFLKWLENTRPQTVNNWVNVVRQKLGTAGISPLDSCTYELLHSALGYSGPSKVERYRDTSAMRAFVFEKRKKLPLADKIWKQRKDSFHEFETAHPIGYSCRDNEPAISS